MSEPNGTVDVGVVIATGDIVLHFEHGTSGYEVTLSSTEAIDLLILELRALKESLAGRRIAILSPGGTA